MEKKQGIKESSESINYEVVEEVRGKMPAEDTFEDLSLFFKVMADETRLRIMWALDTREMCVQDLAETLGMTKSAISHQLSLLRRSNLVKTRRAGKSIFYSLSDDHVIMLFEAGLEHINE